MMKTSSRSKCGQDDPTAHWRSSLVSITMLSMQFVLCSEHVCYQLPNEETQVQNLLDQIQSNDSDLKIATSEARNPDEKKNDFKKTVSHIILKCPVARKM